MSFQFDDVEALKRECRIAQAHTAVEFGPGDSTKAFFDSTAHIIVSLEHDPQWAEVWRPRLKPLADAKRKEWYLHPYYNLPNVIVHTPWQNVVFDIALVDSPYGGTNDKRRVDHPGQKNYARFNTLDWALRHAKVVLLHDADRPREQRAVAALKCKIEMLSERLGKVVPK